MQISQQRIVLLTWATNYIKYQYTKQSHNSSPSHAIFPVNILNVCVTTDTKTLTALYAITMIHSPNLILSNTAYNKTK
jgi:hypothetical protein